VKKKESMIGMAHAWVREKKSPRAEGTKGGCSERKGEKKKVTTSSALKSKELLPGRTERKAAGEETKEIRIKRILRTEKSGGDARKKMKVGIKRGEGTNCGLIEREGMVGDRTRGGDILWGAAEREKEGRG